MLTAWYDLNFGRIQQKIIDSRRGPCLRRHPSIETQNLIGADRAWLLEMTNPACNVSPPFALDDPESSQEFCIKTGRRPPAENHISTDDLDGPPSNKKFFEKPAKPPLIRPPTGCPGYLESSLQFSPKTEVLEGLRRTQEQKTHEAAIDYRKQHKLQQQEERDQKQQSLDIRADQKLKTQQRAAVAQAALSKQHGFDIITLQDKPAATNVY